MKSLQFTSQHCFLSRTAMMLFLMTVLCGTTVRAEGRKVALLVGVNDYRDQEGLEDLRLCVNDVSELGDELRLKDYSVQVMATGDGPQELDPNYDNVYDALRTRFRNADVGDRILFAFSGHGVQVDGEDFLCPMDARIGDGVRNLLAVKDIVEMAKESQATQVVLIVDACRNIVSYHKSVGGNTINADGFDLVKLLQENGTDSKQVAVFQSCKPGQRSLEDVGSDHGLFFGCLLRGIRGDNAADGDGNGLISSSEFASYLSRSVRDRADSLGRTQVPQYFVSSAVEIPILQVPPKLTWIPDNCQPSEGARIITVPGAFGQQSRLYDRLRLTPKFPKSEEGQPVLQSDGKVLEIEMVLVPRIDESMPRSFYMQAGKMSAAQFSAYERLFEDQPNKFDEGSRRQRLANPASDPDHPAFYVSGREAHRFCKDICGGLLPTVRQWNAAYGLPFLDNEQILVRYGQVGYQGEPKILRDEDALNWAAAPNPVPMQTMRSDNPDMSPWGIADMGSNGMEFIAMDPFAAGDFRNHLKVSRLELRGSKLQDLDTPHFAANWVGGITQRFGIKSLNGFASDVSFRLVLEQ